MELTIRGIILFLDTKPAPDEYLGDAIGCFVFDYCLIGLFVHRRARMYGFILFNHALGIWLSRKD